MQSKTNNIGKDSLILTISQFVALGINMLNVMLLSRFRTLEEYGTYSQIIMICTVTITFFSAGFSQCINYFFGKCESEKEKQKFVKNYYTIVTLIGILAGVLTLLLLPALKKYFDNPLMSDYWYVLLFYPISHILNSGVDRFFIAYRKAKGLLAFRVCHSIIILSETTLAVCLNLSFFRYMIIYTISEMIFSVFIYLWIKMLVGVVPFGFDKSIVKSILKFAVPMAVASLISTINIEMDKFVVGGLVDTETMAIYSNAAKELPVYILSTSISSVTMPFVVRKIAEKKNIDAVKLWKKSITLCFYLVCFCVCVLFAFAPQIISILYSDKYLPGVSVFRVYSLVLLFRVTYYGMALNSLGKTKTILRASIATMAINLILDIGLYKVIELINPEFALLGPAIATFVSVAVMNMYQLFLTRKWLQVKFMDIYPITSMLKILLLNTALGVVFYTLQQLSFKVMDFDQITLSIFVGIIWLAVYFIVVHKPIMTLWKELNTGS